jgi:hypothetical protein
MDRYVADTIRLLKSNIEKACKWDNTGCFMMYKSVVARNKGI